MAALRQPSPDWCARGEAAWNRLPDQPLCIMFGLTRRWIRATSLARAGQNLPLCLRLQGSDYALARTWRCLPHGSGGMAEAVCLWQPGPRPERLPSLSGSDRLMRAHRQEGAKTPSTSLMSACLKAGRTSSQSARSGVRTQSAVALHMCVGSGADVIITLPNAEVATQRLVQRF